MIKKGDIAEINIDKLVNEGEGIGKIDGFTVFVPRSVPGDKLKIEIVSAKKSYARGIIKEIIEPSPHRIKPACAVANACSSCQWQYIDYEEQLRAKKQIIEDCFKKIARLEIPVKDVIRSDNPLEYRCKVQYPVQQTKNSGRFKIGYYKAASHDLIDIKYCCTHPEIINKITQFIREKAKELSLMAYNEKTQQGLIRHLVYRYSYSNKNLLLIFVINDNAVPENLKQLCEMIRGKFPEVEGVLVNFNTTHTNIILSSKTELVYGKSFIEENLEGKKFKISAGSFFQVNPSSAVKIFNTVHEIIRERAEKPTVLDVYSGVGTFPIWLKNLASGITAVEESSSAIEDFKTNIELNKTANEANIEIIEGNADKILQDLAEEGRKFDITVLDPPRKGCSDATLDAVMKLTDKYIIYVSCNPATLARDVKLLYEKGFSPEFVQPVDMFCQTYHVESIVVLKKVQLNANC